MAYTGPLEKVDDYRWRIPKSYKAGMRTDAIIFASEDMVPSIREDNAPEQAANVATLPGIVGPSLAMPDIHWGYGFPIGGVAAMDAEEGVISPGGIGFDINCLCEGSRISTDLGGWMRIEDFEREFKTSIQTEDGFTLSLMGGRTPVRTYGSGTSQTLERTPSAFMKKVSDKRVLKVITRTGLELRCSEDHPLLTDAGMRSAMLLKRGDRVAISYFEGVELDAIADRKEIILAKVFGYMLGGGSVYRAGERMQACAYGGRIDMDRMQADLLELGYSSMVCEREHGAPAQYGEAMLISADHELRVQSQEFAKLLMEGGMPVGGKAASDHGVPAWVMGASRAVKRAFLAGLFGAVLSAPSRACSYLPGRDHGKNDWYVEAGRMFLIDLMQLLDELSVETTRIGEMGCSDQKERAPQPRLLIGSEPDNLVRLYRTIGYEYSEKKGRMAEAAVKYLLLKKEADRRKVKAAERTRDLKAKGLKLKEVQALLASEDIDARFIERHYNEQAGLNPPVAFVTFEDFLKDEMGQLESTGYLYDEIASVEEVPYNGHVYDFTVPDTHNFVANGMVVSNCGVRLVRTDLEADDVRPHIKELINLLFKNVPAGVGSKGVIKFSGSGFDDVLRYGAEWAVESGYGWKEDLLATEEGGRMKTADPSKVSDKAKQRGIPQIGSLGSGNHFLEIDFVEKVFDEEAAKAFGLREGQVTVTVHCGSRGAGHQIATDYLQVMERSVRKTGIELPDRQLACAPVHSQEGEDYFKAMSCGANYAWANRQMILHWIRQSFEEQFGADAEGLGLRQVYDVAHNIAKVEEHQVDGRRRTVYVHRKGATRAFPRDHPDVPQQYRSVGQPALIPGNMGAGSYVLVGEEKIMRDAFGSTCHGAGRVMSRSQALRSFTVQGIRDDLGSKGIFLKSATKDGILEEAPEAYKSIDQVISVVVGAGLSRRVAKLTPLGVMKG